MEWNVYGGWQHRFGDILEVGYKYDFMESANHVFARVPFGEKRLPCGMIMIGEKKMNMDFLTRSIIT